MTFQEENDILLKRILNERFFKPWQIKQDDNNYTLWSEASLELYITSLCNQHCEYCYLVKYPDLYPKDALHPDIIKHNLKIIYDWIIKNNFYIPQVDFFSGEIWHSQFGWDILEITLDALRRGAKLPYFLVPSNCSFCLTDKATAKIQHYINEFQKYNSCLSFSISIDGAIIDSKTRQFNNTSLLKTDEYYERIFLFAQHNNFYFHPMVSSENVGQWIENYQWWEKMCKKYSLDISELMMLEVRNPNWTEDSVQSYNQFMKFLIDNDLQKCNNSIPIFVKELFNLEKTHHIQAGYNPYWCNEIITFAPCTIPSQLTIRVGDLTIPPCHRTAYNKLLYGKFIVNDDKITNIKANNIYMAQRILLGNTMTTNFKCDTCALNPFCLKGCFGEQWEDNSDPFMPSTNVCYFFEEKWKFLVSYYYDLGIVQYCKDNFNPFHVHYPRIKEFIDFCEGVNQRYELGKS